MTKHNPNTEQRKEPETKKQLDVEETELADLDLDSVSGGARSILNPTFTNPKTVTIK